MVELPKKDIFKKGSYSRTFEGKTQNFFSHKNVLHNTIPVCTKIIKSQSSKKTSLIASPRKGKEQYMKVMDVYGSAKILTNV